MKKFQEMLEEQLLDESVAEIAIQILQFGIGGLIYTVVSLLAGIVDMDNEYKGFWIHDKIKSAIKDFWHTMTKGKQYIQQGPETQKEIDKIKAKLPKGQKAWVTGLQKRLQDYVDAGDKKGVIALMGEIKEYLLTLEKQYAKK